MNDISLFNVNALIGTGAYEEAQYPSAEYLVVHLNYLGIDRSLVSHVEARDLNPTWGNRRLLREIAESGYSERLIPAFVISPSCYYENGALDFLKESLRAGKVRALRIYPSVSRFPIMLLERILGELAQWEPSVFCDCATFGAENDIRDFISLAEKFPGISFVFTQKMWPGFGSLIDAMWRCKNIYVDISWIHMRDTVNLMIDDFGAERLLFGIGYKSHYGAAIGALAHYQIKSEQRELIAHGNVERLLKIKPLMKKISVEPQILKKKPLWDTFRKGLPLKGVKVIDAHGHVGPTHRGWYIRNIDFDEQIKVLTDQMARLGVEKTVVSAETALFGEPVEGNRFAEKYLLNHKEHFVGYLVFNPRYGKGLIAELDDFFKNGFYVGFKILAGYWKIPVTDSAYEVVWKYAGKYSLPILLHTWDDSYNSPAMLKDIVKKYPNASFLLGHSGGGTRGRIEAEELALSNSNVYLEFCGTFTTPRTFEDSMKIVGIDRVLFGSDTSAHDQAWELGKYLSMPVPDKQLIPGLGENFMRILKKSKIQLMKF
ncbi:MAG: amidohydrolase family protein [Lentisphaerota bacterium]